MTGKPPRLPDWLLGAAGRRRLLEAVLWSGDRVWLESELAEAARLHKKGSVDVHLAPLVQLDILREDDGGYRLNKMSGLLRPLRMLVRALRDVPDAAVQRPP